MGGGYLIEGSTTKFDTGQSAKLSVDGYRYKAAFKKSFGSDYDHGHSYDWTRVDIGVEDMVLGVPVFVSVREILEASPEAIVEVEIEA